MSDVTQNDDFDATKALADLVADQPNYAARKLTFAEQCGAFAALYGGARNSLVARAFGVTQTTVSLLGGCLPYDPDPSGQHYRNGKPVGGYAALSKNRVAQRRTHYADVAREFLALGVEAFNDKYYRPIHERLHAARRAPPRPVLTGPNPAADKYARKTYGAFEINGEFWRVSWVPDPANPSATGWRFSPCKESGEKLEDIGFRWQGRDVDDQPFRTSSEAFDAAYAHSGEDSPRAKPGRPKK